MIENLCPIFEKYNVDLVISGHNHLMELLEKNGVTYVVIGSMGGILDSLEYKSPYSVWLNNRAFGYMDMNLSTEGKIDFTFLDSDGNFLYSYEVQTE